MLVGREGGSWVGAGVRRELGRCRGRKVGVLVHGYGPRLIDKDDSAHYLQSALSYQIVDRIFERVSGCG